ncbi:P-loop containing nucleoside triphosphate hydrolase protein [Rhodofomes roseus]|uniref:DNA 3'-5' helicase n=1 Tax=Rhodofomes roseus TaxID=34475 RepID=A0ABQ8KMB1_9APHY|nr:P-loop containing nucleoside triphosphate hydrolase protein [Rhodofomes roseus]XP_047781219.1 P-loop containing nucleoside triphosphate hydrolase protein [Rhodofomes roseus]KAH9839458.1 P-loop containing nucleoside triphosphate hydrolase protein [Rhodofomes roseus]KAH9839464.1 P-loop containing nucleoside triphosphate hydrolase protein [Rhodofomes roseus]
MARRPGKFAYKLRRTGSKPRPPPRHRKLAPEEVKELAQIMQERFRWESEPRFFQLEGVKAQIEGVDTVIQAPTGSGKTAIAAGPHLWRGNEGKTTIMVCPLLALEEEMVETFKTEFGLTAVAVNGQNTLTKNKQIMEIVRGQYHIVLISPEMLQSRAFKNRVLRNNKFTRRVLSVFIDEAHCLSHWGADFRKHYASLGSVRAFLAPGTPIIAVTATLTARVRRDLHNKLHFPKTGGRFINVGNDRPNVSIVVRACEHPQNTLADLDFVLPETIESASDIPKTYLYVDNIETGNDIIDHLGSILRQRNPALYELGVIRPFNATMSADYRTHAMAAFRNNRPVRILVCTDAAGMGCNVPDVDRVVQWKLPATLSNFIQRAGRAARARNRTGIAILLVERSAYSINLQTRPAEQDEPEPKTSKGKQRARKSHGPPKSTRQKTPKNYAKRHGIDRGSSAGPSHDTVLDPADNPIVDHEAADEGLLAFVQSTQCRRKIWQEMYESPLSEAATASAIVPCCDICDSSLLNRARPPLREKGPKASRPKVGLPDPNAQTALESWREQKLDNDHPHAVFGATAILSDSLIERLTSSGPKTRPALATMLKTWLWRDRYEGQLTDLLLSLQIQSIPKPKAGHSIGGDTSTTTGQAQSAGSRKHTTDATDDQHPPKRARRSVNNGVCRRQ